MLISIEFDTTERLTKATAADGGNGLDRPMGLSEGHLAHCFESKVGCFFSRGLS